MIVEHLLGQDWEITPAGGATGEAFIAKHKKEKLFLKRNSSPFLAVLSVEKIVPKLVWTKRLENGDVITAQEWLKGRELEPHEMKDIRVAKLLRKIHSSAPLQTMLQRLGKTIFEPQMMLTDVVTKLDKELQHLIVIQKSLRFLEMSIQTIDCGEYVVCHGDVNHNNWLLSEGNQLYLIDWDGAMLADPAVDIGMLLYWYIPEEQWPEWLSQYGIALTDSLHLRMKWYVLAQTLLSIDWHRRKHRYHEMNHLIHFLQLHFFEKE